MSGSRIFEIVTIVTLVIVVFTGMWLVACSGLSKLAESATTPTGPTIIIAIGMGIWALSVFGFTALALFWRYKPKLGQWSTEYYDRGISAKQENDDSGGETPFFDVVPFSRCVPDDTEREHNARI